MMREIGVVKSIYWKRKYFDTSNFKDILFIKVELLDRMGSNIDVNLDDKLKISTVSGLLTFVVSEIVFEDDYNDYSKISVIAQSIDDIDSAPSFKNKVLFVNKLISSKVYKEV